MSLLPYSFTFPAPLLSYPHLIPHRWGFFFLLSCSIYFQNHFSWLHTHRANPLHATKGARGHKPAEFAFPEKSPCHISPVITQCHGNEGYLGTGTPITALPSPSHVLCPLVLAVLGLKHKNSDFGSQNEVAPGQFSAQTLSSWVREAKVQRRAASTIKNMFWAWGLEELKIGTCGLNYRTKGRRG